MNNEDRISRLAAVIDEARALGRARNATLREPEWWRQNAFVRPSISGQHVTPETAMSVTAVFACVRVLAESVASLPMMVYRRLPDGGKEVATDHPLYSLLHDSPNRDQTAFEANEFRMASLALRGNSYSVVRTNRRADVIGIDPLRPQFMDLARNAAGELVFDYQEPGAARSYTQDEIWFTRGFGTDGIKGLSPIGCCRDAVGYAMTLNEHGSRLFANGAQVGATIEIPGEWSDKAFDNFKRDFNDNHGGRLNAGKPLILEGGAKFQSIGLSSVDAEFIASQKLQIAEIARIFRVPLHMLNELDKATFSNIEHQSLEFVTQNLRPWLVRIEQSANRDLFGPYERGRYFVEFKLDALLRGDIKSRYEAYASGITNGWLKRNEVRQLENLNPEEGLDELLVPLNMQGANDPKPGEPGQAKNIAAQAKAVRIERERLDDETFVAWARDYFARLGQRDGADYGERVQDLITLGAEGAIAKWSNPDA